MSNLTSYAPCLVTNTGVLVEQNDWVTVTSDMLLVVDDDTPPEQLVYTITHLPTGGMLQLNGQLLDIESSFTQDDINQGRLTYFRNGNAGSGDLGFIFSDGVQEMTYLAKSSNGTSTSFSASGRYIAFESDDSNLVDDDTNRAVDAFVYDRYLQTYERVSLSSSGVQGNGGSYGPTISTDGKYVSGQEQQTL